MTDILDEARAELAQYAEHDVDYVMVSPTLVSDLIAEVERLRKALDGLVGGGEHAVERVERIEDAREQRRAAWRAQAKTMTEHLIANVGDRLTMCGQRTENVAVTWAAFGRRGREVGVPCEECFRAAERIGILGTSLGEDER